MGIFLYSFKKEIINAEIPKVKNPQTIDNFHKNSEGQKIKENIIRVEYIIPEKINANRFKKANN